MGLRSNRATSWAPGSNNNGKRLVNMHLKITWATLLEIVAINCNYKIVKFPVMSRIPTYPDWSITRQTSHVNFDANKMQAHNHILSFSVPQLFNYPWSMSYHFRGSRNKEKMSNNCIRDSLSAGLLSLVSNNVPEALNCKDFHKYLAWKFADVTELHDIPSIVASNLA
ncbi:hypothetical protein C5167_036550 [Papaver somniferum]|uniref:Uncharacterized protein n=1 Tax=Papaver somniferum TaxID=3469 RepID=A0A4Y7I865_PAPSO|nr:hypothetical protein C5167_036550 [Papaver somniferum]